MDLLEVVWTQIFSQAPAFLFRGSFRSDLTLKRTSFDLGSLRSCPDLLFKRRFADMVYSEELGYDPEEWEECPPPDHFLAFGWFTRTILAACAITFAFLFFYVIEKRKTWVREERRASFASITPLVERNEEEEVEETDVKFATAIRKAEAVVNSRAASRSRSRTTTPIRKRLSEADMVALEKWENDVKEVERQRLAASESPPPYVPPTSNLSQKQSINGGMSRSSDEQTVIPIHEQQPEKKFSVQTVESFDQPRTPPTTPPEKSESQSALLNEHYERLAAELEQKLWVEIQNEAEASAARATPTNELQARLHRRHEPEIQAAAAQLQQHPIPEAQTAAEEFRRRFEDQIDNMVEEYNRLHGRQDAGAHSSNESDVEQFEQVGDSPALFYPSESDDPEAEATSFTYEPSPASNRPLVEPRHAAEIIYNRESSEKGPIPEVYINDQRTAVDPHAKKSSSSSEEGFVKIYSDLVEKTDNIKRHSTPPAPESEEQMREILQEYESVSKTVDSFAPTVQSSSVATHELTPPPLPVHQQTTQKPTTQITIQTQQPPQQVPLSTPQTTASPASGRRSPSPQVQVPLVPLSGYLGPSGRLYPQGPDGLYYEQTSDGQLVPISPELQQTLQDQQISGTQQPLIKTTDGKIYQQDKTTVQKVIYAEIQQTLQTGKSRSAEPQEVIEGPNGVLYEIGPMGQFYEPGPDGRSKRVTPDIQRQLLDLVEERKRKSEAEAAERERYEREHPEEAQNALKRLTLAQEGNPAIIQSSDGKIFELTSSGQFFQLGRDGLLYRIPYELQEELMKIHKKKLAAKQQRIAAGSTESETPPFDPEYPYHPRRRQPMQQRPEAVGSPEPANAYELDRQDTLKAFPVPEFTAKEMAIYKEHPEEIPPEIFDRVQAALQEEKRKLHPDPKEAAKVRELLHEYDLSTSTDASRDHRETRPSPSEEVVKQQLKLLDTKPTAQQSSAPESPNELDALQVPAEQEAGFGPQSPSVSSGQLISSSPQTFDHRSATQPPPESVSKHTEDPKKYRESSEQSANRDHRRMLAQQTNDRKNEDPRRLVEAEIYLQDAIDYVDNQNRNNSSSGFVMEEDMLGSSEKLPLRMQNASADPTSRLVPTTDVFEKPEPGFDDADDAQTYAPEIQSLEVPPDEVSQASSNLIDNLPDETVYPDNLCETKPIEATGLKHTSASSPQLQAMDTQFTYEDEQQAPIQMPQRHQEHRISIQLPQLYFDSQLNDQHGIVACTKSKTQAQNPTTTQQLENYQEREPDQPFLSTKQSAIPLGSTIPDQQPETQWTKRNDDRQKGGADEHREQTTDASLPQPMLLHQSPAHVSTVGTPPTPQAPQFWSARKRSSPNDDNASVSSRSSRASTRSLQKQSSLLSALGVTSMQEMLLTLTSIEELSAAMRKAGLETTNLIFGIDYTASNKYQGEHSFDGRSLHFVDDPTIQNPYQSVIQIMGRSLAPFTSKTIGIPVYGFGDNESGDWGVFPLNGTDGICRDLDEVLRVYNEATPNIALGGPTNFAPLIYQAIQHCQRFQDYHILIISCDGQVTNERATRKAIVQACQFPLSIIVVGVGDGPWEMMRVFDESLPKRSWDNFHFVEFREVIRSPQDPAGELAFAIQTLLEVPDQYHHIRTLGMLPNKSST
ncbi:VWFA domain-containing protein [Aphelenchoides besseyi]|nr:VWFA domain-containing protein [Aphelenchoides besseyi]